MQCLSERNLKHFAGSRIGSSGAYKRALVAGKEDTIYYKIVYLSDVDKGEPEILDNRDNEKK